MLITLISWVISLSFCLFLYVAKFLLAYGSYFFVILLVKVLYRVRYQVLNDDLKEKPSIEQAVLITGATSGIGLAVARHSFRRGYTVIAGYYTKAEPGYEELLKLNETKKNGNSIFLVEINVRSEESIVKSYEIVKKILTDNNLHLRALVNNAGIACCYQTHLTPHKTTRAIVETNLLGPMLVTRQYMPLLIKAPNGRVINVSSLLSYFSIPWNTIYGATKCGLAYYTNNLSLDVKRHKVSTVSIHPGNLIKNTAIVNNAYSNFEKLYDESTEEEKELFSSDFKKNASDADKYMNLMKKLNSKSSQSETKERSQLQKFKRLLNIYINKASGDIGSCTRIEDTPFIETFDNAISMRKPLDRMYAGNRFYSIVTGAWLESLSHSSLNLLTSSKISL